MELRENWLTEGLIDFEYKKYVLLAYLKSVKASFERTELYPFLSDLVFHYRNLLAVKESKSLIFESFPKKLSLESMESLKLTYQRIVEDDAIMQELSSIVEYSIPKVKASLDEGSSIYEEVESHCEISTVGITSLSANEGYLFITQPPESETDVFRYQITIFDNSNETYRGIHTRYLVTEPRRISNTYESMKLRLIKEFADLPNPGAFLVLSKLRVPLNSTLMPVAKRLLVKQVSQAA